MHAYNTYIHTHTHTHTRDRLDKDTDGDGISDREEGVPLWRIPNKEVKPLAPIDSDGDGIKGKSILLHCDALN